METQRKKSPVKKIQGSHFWKQHFKGKDARRGYSRVFLGQGKSSCRGVLPPECIRRRLWSDEKGIGGITGLKPAIQSHIKEKFAFSITDSLCLGAPTTQWAPDQMQSSKQSKDVTIHLAEPFWLLAEIYALKMNCEFIFFPFLSFFLHSIPIGSG